ncbi:MAG TPA: DUF4260 domain-containing protein [Anaerolineales bacterium]
MKRLMKLEELGQLLLSILLFSQLSYAWWVYLLLLLAPDLGMIGYLFGPRVGAVTYNTTHHKGLAAVLYAIGILYAAPVLALIGVIMFGHSSLDRVLGFGLKYGDSFQHTHLGWIGRSRGAGASAP